MWYTRKGDGGTTGLFGTKERMPKDHPLFEALGSVDELNSLIGLCSAYVRECNDHAITLNRLGQAQEGLFLVQAELAGADKRINQTHVDVLETLIGDIEGCIEKPKSFVVPGATVLSALFDYTRTVSRRAERCVLRAQNTKEISAEMRSYLNRLSSLFYALARYVAQTSGVAERPPTYDLKNVTHDI